MERNLIFKQDLIQLVREGKAAIQHTQKVEDLELLNKLLKEIFPKDKEERVGGTRYYSIWGANSLWVGFFLLPSGMTAIPLHDFIEEDKSGLSQYDKDIIYGIVQKLQLLNETYNKDFFELKSQLSVLIDVNGLSEPEVEYVEWVGVNNSFVTKGKIYEVVETRSEGKEFRFINDKGNLDWSFIVYTIPSTREKFLEQESKPQANTEQRWIVKTSKLNGFENDYYVTVETCWGQQLSSEEAQATADYLKACLTNKDLLEWVLKNKTAVNDFKERLEK